MAYDPVQVARREKPFEVNGKWGRWNRYDLLNSVIIPADDATYEQYDPWDAYRSNAGKYRGALQQPYTALLELDRELSEMRSRGIRPYDLRLDPRHLLKNPIVGPRTEADRLILQWCTQHGLLGLVPVLSNSIRLSATIKSDGDEFTRVLKAPHHFRDGGTWYARKVLADHVKPGVTWFNWISHVYEEKPLDHIELFFRPIWKDEPFSLPCPNTPSFRQCYGEPVQDFIYWCKMFALSVNNISLWQGGRSKGERQVVQQSYWALSGLAQGAASSFRFRYIRNRVDEERVSAGLLASYALMFLWDRAEGRRALRCHNQNCGRYFVANEMSARYCSPRCQNTAQTRRFRSRQAANA
jgi:hypothetical protein